MSTTTYDRRKATGKCPNCGDAPAPDKVYCAPCQQGLNAKRTSERLHVQGAHLMARLGLSQADATALARQLAATRVAVLHGAVGGRRTASHTLACCGVESPIVTLPHHCPSCGAVYLVPPVRPGTKEG